MGPNTTTFVVLDKMAESSNDTSDGAFISDEIMEIFGYLNYTVLNQVIVLFGVVTNIINAIVFYKIGFKDSINISLFGLAIADCFGCLTLIWFNLMLNPWFQAFDLPFDPVHMHYLIGGWPHLICARITGIITAFITFERCLCVLMPLKVKDIFTQRRVIVINVSTYIISIAAVIPVFCTNGYAPIYFPERNKTLIGLVFSDNKAAIAVIHLPIIDMFLPIFTFFFVIVCTVLLVSSLKKKAKWRETATGASKSTDISSKEKKIARLVSTIAILFIVCYVPITLATFLKVYDRQFSLLGKRKNLFHVTFAYIFLLESINSSMNILIYYYKSTNYRNMFNKMFGRKVSLKEGETESRT